MNPQETQQVVARDEKWVPSTERVKISSTNVRLETTVQQKEETFQVVIDVIKNSTYFKAFTITAEVPKIFMQQFWYTIKKVKDSESYEFLLANKKCIVDAKVFRKILDICPRVEGVDFTEDDGIVSRLKFVKIGEDYQEYGLAIHDMMLNDAIKQSESYQMFIKYSTGQIPPKKSRGKGSQGKKTTDTHVADVDVSEEYEPEPAKKRTASRRVVKKKVTISADDNVIPDPYIALELGKSISLTKAEEEEAARQVHATRERIVTEFEPEPAKKKIGSRSTRSVVIQDTPSAPKPKPAASKPKLKGVQSLTPEEQEAADTMQALKESKKTSRRQPGTGGSSEGTGRIPGVPDESTLVFATSSEGTGTKPGVPDEENVSTEEKVILEWGSEQESEYLEEYLSEEEEIDWIDFEEDDEKKDDTNDDKSIDHEMTDDEETDNEVLQGKEQVNDDEDEYMSNAEVEESGNGDEEDTDAAKVDTKKTKEAKDDSKKVELPPTSSSLSVSSGFGDQFLKISSNTSFIGTVKDNTDVEINSLLDIKIQSEVPHIQSSSVLKVLVFVISEPLILTPVQESPSVAPVTTLLPTFVSTIPPIPHQTTAPIHLPPITTDAPTITTVVPEFDALSVVQLRVAKLEKDVSELKKIDHSAKALATLKSQVPTVVEQYLGSKISDDLQKTPTINLEQESEKSASKILKIKKEQAEKQKMPKYTIKSTDNAVLKEYDLKSALYHTMHENEYFNKNPANHRLYHALMEDLIEDENVMDKGVADIVKDHKRKHYDDDDDNEEDPPAGLNQGKAPSKGSKTGKCASAKEPVEELIVEVAMDDVVNTASEDVQPPTPPTPDPEWNKRQVILGQPEQPWFNQMVSATKDPLTFNNLMATPIDFSNIKLEYNFQECFNTLTDKLDWNNPEGDRYPFDLSKPLPLVKKLHGYGHLEEVMVKRADRQLYKFKEGDFVDLHLNDIKDMLILAVQHKLYHLNDSDIFDFIMALRMFTRSLIIKRCVEDLQLSIESYQKKLNITAPQQTFSEIEFKELYTPSYKPPRDELHHRILDFYLGYNDEMSRRKWTTIDKKISELMVELIDKHMRERRIIKNLERLVGTRELEMDYKLMTRTNRRDLPRDIPFERIEVLKYDTKGVKVRKGQMQTKIELTLEQTQQGVSNEVLVSIEGVEELKRNVKIKGEKKEALLTLRVMPKSIHSDNGNPSRANIKQALRFVVRAFTGSSYKFNLDKDIIRVTPEKVHKILGVPLGGTSIFDLPEIPLDDPFVKLWFKQFDPKPLKDIHAIDIARKLVLAKRVDFMFKVNFLMLFANVMGTADTMKVIVNLTILRLIRQRPAIRSWTTAAMNLRQELEIQEEVIGKLDLHRTCSESEVDQTEGFYDVGDNSFCRMIEEKLSMISDEKVALEDLLKRANTEFPNDENVVDLHEKYGRLFKETVLPEDLQAHLDDFYNNDGGEVTMMMMVPLMLMVLRKMVRMLRRKRSRRVGEEDLFVWPRAVQPVNVVCPRTPQRVITCSSPKKRVVKPSSYLTSAYMNKKTKVIPLVEYVEGDEYASV
ncbi:hypothetical protein Tco_0312385 [Tanacetum coccineum]